MRHVLRFLSTGVFLAGTVVLAGCGGQPSAVKVPSSQVSPPPANSSQPPSSSKTSGTTKSTHYIVGGQAYAGQANFKKYEAAAQAQPNNYSAQLNAGVSAFVNRDYATAIAYYKKAAKLQPHNGEPLNNIGNVYFRGLGQPAMALPYYQQTTRIQSSYAYGWLNLVLCEKALGNMTAAKAAVAEGLQKVSPRDPLYNDLKIVLSAVSKSGSSSSK